MAKVSIIEQVDTGEIIERAVTISTSEFSVKLDTTGDGNPDTLFSPAVTTQVEIENDGDQSTPQDQCGNTERIRTSNRGWSIRVQGIVTDEEREGNLTMQMLRDMVAPADSVDMRSDVISGNVAVSNTVITQANDLTSIETEDTIGKESAYEFQLQLGESESDE